MRPLAEVARDYKRGAADPRKLFAAFVDAPLYWIAPKDPEKAGIPVVRIEGRWVAPLFSSEAELARVVGHKRWMTAKGLDVLSLLPGGVRIGLDMGSPHRLQLDPAAARLEYALVIPGGPAHRPNGSDHNGDR